MSTPHGEGPGDGCQLREASGFLLLFTPPRGDGEMLTAPRMAVA